MKIPYEWLKEYVDIDWTAEELCEKMTLLGFETTAEKSGPFTLLDIEVFSNRPDCLSIIGIAREIAALSGVGMAVPFSGVKENGRAQDYISVDIQTGLCPRYCARVIKNISVKPSPPWLARRLEASGIRAVNNIVDATNYCLLEMGHPLHAFDMEKIAGSRIIVRQGGEGESLITLDEAERKIDPDIMVIADAEKPAAIAGIMGGKYSEVGPETRNILLEGACFEPSSIRQSAKRLQMETEASYRFQRGSDIEGILPALERAAFLIQELSGGEVAGGAVDSYPGKAPARTVSLRPENAEKVLGTAIKEDFIREKLCLLGFKVSGENNSIEIEVPSFRRDVRREIDVIEEIARFHGFENIPARIPGGAIPVMRESRGSRFAEDVRNLLAGYGLNEVVTHSLLSGEAARFFAGEDELVKITNPLGEEQSYMRTSLLPGILSVAATNIKRGIADVRLFEIGRVFAVRGACSELLYVSGLFAGAPDAHWKFKREEYGFFHAKGIVDSLVEDLKARDVSFSEFSEGPLAPGQACFIDSPAGRCGILGRVAGSAAEYFGLDVPVYVFELDAAVLEKVSGRDMFFKPLARFPASFRDISVSVGEQVKASQLEKTILEAGRGMVEKVELFDIYRGKQVPAGFKSMAYSISYRAANKTLTDEEVDSIHEAISNKLTKEFGGHLRDGRNDG